MPAETILSNMLPPSVSDLLTMTLRDYFAAKAMQALIAKPSLKTPSEVAFEAYRIAGAMMKARSPEET